MKEYGFCKGNPKMSYLFNRSKSDRPPTYHLHGKGTLYDTTVKFAKIT